MAKDEGQHLGTASTAEAEERFQGGLQRVSCPLSTSCRCITGGQQAAQIVNFHGLTLAAGGVPACSNEIRHIIAPGMTGEHILKEYPRDTPRGRVQEPVVA